MSISPEHDPTPSPSVTIAFSGPDNVGKTKQIGVLSRRLGPAAQATGPLDDHDPRWDGIKSMGMGTWWFDRGPIEEVADVLAGSYLERSRRLSTAPVRLMDRGIPMLEASLAATVAVRERSAPARPQRGPARCWSRTRSTFGRPSTASCSSTTTTR
ncbi:hypothetical protein [Kitasatospora sp. NPDC058218]|uniref:hypothetical protein n=1 Tax=Kitasatospora sp. NPDC058218 TaxID=3346385 RepID=UPI0036DF9D95